MLQYLSTIFTKGNLDLCPILLQVNSVLSLSVMSFYGEHLTLVSRKSFKGLGDMEQTQKVNP